MKAGKGTHCGTGCRVESSARDGARGMIVVHAKASARGNLDREGSWVGWVPIERRGSRLIVIISNCSGRCQRSRAPVEVISQASVEG